jgi:ATP-dependent Zn protease
MEIDMELIREAMDKRTLGMPGARLPPSEAKLRMATVQAARAVSTCLTPGIPPLIHVSIQPRAGIMSRIVFMPQVRGAGSRFASRAVMCTADM